MNGKRKSADFDRTSGVIKPQLVMEAVYRITKRQAYVASDVGQHQMFAALHYPFDLPRRLDQFRWCGYHGLWFASCIRGETCTS